MEQRCDLKEPEAAHRSCYRLIYRSHSLLRGGKDEAGLAEILKTGPSNNADLGITGALMLYDDWFAQVLEGPQAAVEAFMPGSNATTGTMAFA